MKRYDKEICRGKTFWWIPVLSADTLLLNCTCLEIGIYGSSYSDCPNCWGFGYPPIEPCELGIVLKKTNKYKEDK